MKMIYAAEEFKKERASWPPIIHYNIIRHVVKIIRLLDEAIHEQGDSLHSPPRDSTSSDASAQLHSHNHNDKFTTEHRVLCLRLKPLVDIEADVSKHLLQSLARREGQEVCVHTYFAWSKHFRPERGNSKGKGLTLASTSSASPSRGSPGDTIRNEASRVLHASCKDILRLWNDPQVRDLLNAQDIQLEHEAGFFLDDLERVTALDYTPTDRTSISFSLSHYSLLIALCPSHPTHPYASSNLSHTCLLCGL